VYFALDFTRDQHVPTSSLGISSFVICFISWGAGVMIHYTCDRCKRTINPENELRYVVRLEVYASLDPIEDELHDDRDHLQEIQEILERLDDAQDDQICDDVYHHQRFDLCSECRKRYVSNPLARPTTHHLDFSQN